MQSPTLRASRARVAPPSALAFALLASTALLPAQSPAKNAAAPAAPYVVEFDALDAAAAERAEGIIRKLASVARVESSTRVATVSIWTKQAEGAAHPQLLNTARVTRRLAAVELKVRAISAPQWSKVKVYVVEATGGG